MLKTVLFGLFLVGAPAHARSVFVNGVDISGSFDQSLKDVDVRIDHKGNIFISAPHYEVQEEDQFFPLSAVAPKNVPISSPKHRGPAPLHRASNSGAPTKPEENAGEVPKPSKPALGDNQALKVE